jgi:ubiquinone/menaquinone biosynthesis C-methylase UbiE
MVEQYIYPGSELTLFAKAINWKKYFSPYIKPYIKKNVLEVGAGIGSTTALLNDGTVSKWLLLEPDEIMGNELKEKIDHHEFPPNCEVVIGTLEQLSQDKKFDTIIYIDVLEHIEDDRKEIKNASALLNENGHLIILSPAFPFLFSPFDKAIGHFRRYTIPDLKKIIPTSLVVVKLKYLDTIGFFASFANRLFLRQSYPTAKQIALWDKMLIPVSKITDKIFLHSFGKTVLAILKKS